MSRGALVFAVALSLTARGPSAAAAGAPGAAPLEYRVAFASANRLESQLDELGREGFACVAVARPDPGSRVPGVVAILGRPSGAAGSVATHRVIVGGRDDMKAPLSQAGADGFRLCGVVLDEDPKAPRAVAVMSRTGTGSWQYEAEVLLRYKESLARLNALGREGFVPVAAAPVDDSRVPDMRHWMVVAERPASGATPHEVTVRSDPGPTGLARNLNESGKQGYRVELLWKEGNDYVAMLARPAGEGSAPSHGYGVETDTTDRVHWLKGLGLADFPYLDRRLFVTDGGVRASNELVEDALPALGASGAPDGSARAALGTIGDHVSRNHGFDVTYARVGRDKGGRPVLAVAIARRDDEAR